MEASATPLLDKRSKEVQERLVIQQGSREKAEAWLGTPSGFPLLHGLTPDQWFEQLGERNYLNWTSNLRVEATGAFPAVR